MYETFPVANIAPHERFDYFAGVVDDLFSPTLCETSSASRQSFRCDVRSAEIGQLKIAKVSTDALCVSRRRRDIARISDAPYLVKFQLQGESLFTQRGNEAHLRPGDFVICSTAEPYHLRFDGPYQMSVLAVADNTMQRMLRNIDQLLGQRMPADDPSCGLLSSFVSVVVDKIESLPGPMAERVETNLLDLLGGVVSARTEATTIARQPALDTLVKVRGFIDDNLRNRRLGPAMVASAFGISTRYLHKLFSAEPETLTRYIRRCRLEACRQTLIDPAAQSMSITEIALHWGFYDLSHMTRAFSSQFGASPSAFRAAEFRDRLA